MFAVPPLPDAVAVTLSALADRLGIAADPWWVIGGAAALPGVNTVAVTDVDIVLSIGNHEKRAAALPFLFAVPLADAYIVHRNRDLRRWVAALIGRFLPKFRAACKGGLFLARTLTVWQQLAR